MTRLDRTNAPHHVYRCFDADDRLIYVGSSANLFGRLTQHRRTSWWSPQVAHVTAKVYPNGTIAREVERTAIRSENPRWNKAGRAGALYTWDQDGWDDWLTMLINRKTHATELSRFAAAYIRQWGVEPPQMDAVTASELASEQQQAEWRDRTAEAKVRQEEVRREDELAIRRERKRAKAKAKRLAKKLKQVREVIEDCDLAIGSTS